MRKIFLLYESSFAHIIHSFDILCVWKNSYLSRKINFVLLFLKFLLSSVILWGGSVQFVDFLFMRKKINFVVLMLFLLLDLFLVCLVGCFLHGVVIRWCAFRFFSSVCVWKRLWFCTFLQNWVEKCPYFGCGVFSLN